MGIVACTPRQLIDEATVILQNNRFLESKLNLLQEQLFHLEREQKKLVSLLTSYIMSPTHVEAFLFF